MKNQIKIGDRRFNATGKASVIITKIDNDIVHYEWIENGAVKSHSKHLWNFLIRYPLC